MNAKCLTSETVDTKGRPVSSTTIDMSGARKAALLLVSIGHERAARILQSLSEVEVERVMTEIANLGPVDEALVNHVMKDFVSQAHRQNRVPQGGVEVAKELLVRGPRQQPESRSGARPDRRHPGRLAFPGLDGPGPQRGRFGACRASTPRRSPWCSPSSPPSAAWPCSANSPRSFVAMSPTVWRRSATPSPEALRAVEAGLERRILSVATRPARTQCRRPGQAARGNPDPGRRRDGTDRTGAASTSWTLTWPRTSASGCSRSRTS